jgi:FkbM family methyltransferase
MGKEFEMASGNLAHEIIPCDVYGLRTCACSPDVVYDIGANIGWFTLWARVNFPAARIVAVEPHLPSLEYLRYWSRGMTWLTTIHAAIGMGKIKRELRHFGVHHRFADSLMDTSNPTFQDGHVSGIMLDAVEVQHGGLSQFWKIDCEGGEFSIFHHPPSMRVLSRAEHVAIEIHPGIVRKFHGRPAWDVAVEFLRKMAITHTVRMAVDPNTITASMWKLAVPTPNPKPAEPDRGEEPETVLDPDVPVEKQFVPFEGKLNVQHC